LIDDSLTDLRLLMDMMTARHMRVSVAFDGEKGYQQATLQQPSLILLDVCMPGMDGFATCRHLKANPVTQLIPVIFLTAANDLDERLEGFALGAVDYIGKPFNEAEVLARVGVHLRLAQRTALRNDSVGDAVVPEDMARDAVLVQAAQKILGDLIANPPSLDHLAGLLGTNRRRITESFQSCCGQPVFGWLREERLRQAHHLICRTDTPISLIGEHLGYSSPANFTKAVRERFGVSPRHLRREVQMPRSRTEI
jgi:DNA-binding response OmpR family regulator